MNQHGALVVAGLTAVCSLVVCVGCRATGTSGPIATEITEVQVSIPVGMRGGADASWTVSWLGGMGPFTVTLDLDVGNGEGVLSFGVDASPLNSTVTMANPSAIATATNTYAVTVTDSLGTTATAGGTYQVGPRLNEPPSIEDASYDSATGVLTVVVSDPDETDALTVVLDLPVGLAADSGTLKVAGPWPATAYLQVWPVVVIPEGVGGVVGEWTLTVMDEAGESDSATVAVAIAGIELEPDTLYAIPLRTHAAVDEPVLVVVATGPIALDKPFQFMNGVGLVGPRAGHQVGNSFNAGVPGGYRYDVDGFWEAMDPSGTFLVPPDAWWEYPSYLGGGGWCWDFNLTPIGGHDVTGVSGVLFNVAFRFDLPGTYELGFQEYFGVDRTYYTDSECNVYYWGDITNDHPGIPNSIVVTWE